MEDGVEDVVSGGWFAIDSLDISGKISHCGSELKEWGRKIAPNFWSDIVACKKNMMILRDRNDRALVKHFNALRTRLANTTRKT